MACGCGGKRAIVTSQFSSPAAQSRNLSLPSPSAQMAVSQLNTPLMVRVIYQGPRGNHYIPSPAHKRNHYGYGSFGQTLDVHRDDVFLRPDLFYPTSVFEATKVWPDYPIGVPDLILGVLAEVSYAVP